MVKLAKVTNKKVKYAIGYFVLVRQPSFIKLDGQKGLITLLDVIVVKVPLAKPV